jgi:hypothetical protein
VLHIDVDDASLFGEYTCEVTHVAGIENDTVEILIQGGTFALFQSMQLL